MSNVPFYRNFEREFDEFMEDAPRLDISDDIEALLDRTQQSLDTLKRSLETQQQSLEKHQQMLDSQQKAVDSQRRSLETLKGSQEVLRRSQELLKETQRSHDRLLGEIREQFKERSEQNDTATKAAQRQACIANTIAIASLVVAVLSLVISARTLM